MTDMTDSIRFYDRALQRLTRRELLNIAWKLGVAAVAQPLVVDTRVRAAALQELSVHARRRVRRSVARQRGACGRGSRRSRSTGGGMPMANVEVGWEIARDRAFADDGVERDGRGPAGARSQRPRRGERPRAGARVLLSFPRRP